MKSIGKIIALVVVGAILFGMGRLTANDGGFFWGQIGKPVTSEAISLVEASASSEMSSSAESLTITAGIQESVSESSVDEVNSSQLDSESSELEAPYEYKEPEILNQRAIQRLSGQQVGTQIIHNDEPLLTNVEFRKLSESLVTNGVRVTETEVTRETKSNKDVKTNISVTVVNEQSFDIRYIEVICVGYNRNGKAVWVQEYTQGKVANPVKDHCVAMAEFAEGDIVERAIIRDKISVSITSESEIWTVAAIVSNIIYHDGVKRFYPTGLDDWLDFAVNNESSVVRGLG